MDKIKAKSYLTLLVYVLHKNDGL